MTVSIEAGKQDNRITHKYWDAMYEPLFKFLDREDNYNYTVNWLQNRDVNHETFNSMFMPAIVPTNVIRNLGIEKVATIMDAIRPTEKEKKNVLLYYFNSEDPRACKHSVIIHDE